MQNERLYSYNDEDLGLRRVSKRSVFINVGKFFLPYIILAFLIPSAYYVVKRDSYEGQISLLNERIDELVRNIEMEEESDTLHIKIAQATLEGRTNQPINDSIVFEYIVSCKAWYPEVIMAQYRIESGGGTSDIAKKANNLFGMRPVRGERKHYTTQRYGDNYCGYAVYDNWKLSILDKILWEHYIFNGVKPDRETYISAHANYAEAPNYIENIKRLAERYR